MGDHQAILNRIAEVSHAVGSQARVSASEVAGLIVSFLYANPEYTDRFMVEGSDLLVDGTITPEAGSLSYMSANGSIMTPRELRASTGRLET